MNSRPAPSISSSSGFARQPFVLPAGFRRVRLALPTNLLFWSALGVVLLAVFFSFRSFAIREVVWAYPANYDQTKYLAISYGAFEVMLRDGFLAAIDTLYRGAYENGILIHFDALLVFLFFGASRFTALSVHYVHLVIYLTAFVWSVKRLTNSRRLAGLAFGLAFGSGPFWFATIIDYRLDFSAACVFGMFVSAVLASGVFRSRNESAVAGLIAGLMMLTRFLSSLYLAGIYALLAAYFLARLAFRQDGGDDRARLYHLFSSGLLAAGIALPAIWLNRIAIYNYYVVQQGKEIAIRAIEFPAGGVVAALLYYPKSLLSSHVGIPLLSASIVILCLALAVGFRRGTHGRPVVAATVPVRESFVFLLCCVAVIMGALTANTTRSPIVIGILVPVFSWAVFLTFFAWLRPWLAVGDRVAQRACAGAAVLAVGVAAGAQVSNFARHLIFMQQRMDVTRLVEMYDVMGAVSERAGWGQPVVGTDSMRDYFVAGAPLALYYERHGVLVNFTGVLGATGSVNALPRDVLLSQLSQVHFLILTHRRDPLEPPYPAVEAIEAIRPELEEFARSRLAHLGTYEIFGRDVDLYSRPPLAK